MRWVVKDGDEYVAGYEMPGWVADLWSFKREEAFTFDDLGIARRVASGTIRAGKGSSETKVYRMAKAKSNVDLSMSQQEAEFLMTLLVQHVDLGEHEEAQALYDALEGAGIAESFDLEIKLT